ncbi:hypothetical protein WQ56_08885 [Luteimonas sp. FCS-9]|nr:hypothetical protein WQ56_08885 [Luteimonas sp. FCS-9]
MDHSPCGDQISIEDLHRIVSGVIPCLEQLLKARLQYTLRQVAFDIPGILPDLTCKQPAEIRMLGKHGLHIARLSNVFVECITREKLSQGAIQCLRHLHRGVVRSRLICTRGTCIALFSTISMQLVMRIWRHGVDVIAVLSGKGGTGRCQPQPHHYCHQRAGV